MVENEEEEHKNRCYGDGGYREDRASATATQNVLGLAGNRWAECAGMVTGDLVRCEGTGIVRAKRILHFACILRLNYLTRVTIFTRTREKRHRFVFSLSDVEYEQWHAYVRTYTR